MSKAKTQAAQVEARPAKVHISGFAADFYSELQRLIREGYCMVLEGWEAPHCHMNQWQEATLVLPEV